ncbi:DUF3592 domain-containing protein [Streptomyces sp. NPDC050095]|uniref:DUF3592 domain-containing protein n=1 Tax=unclassified Streptomyces TaxID=2593676 RepID=UPI003448AE2E
MELLFFLVPLIIACGAVGMGVVVVRRSLQLRAAWNSGLTAEARCLRAYTHTSGGEHPTTTQHHVYEFTTREGGVVRIDEEGGPATTVQGDVVVVRYAADRPENATAHPPQYAANVVGTGVMLGFLALVAVFCVVFMNIASDAPSDGFSDMPGGEYSDVQDGDYSDMPSDGFFDTTTDAP